MTDRYENIRRALEMGPTRGPWQDIGPIGAGKLIAAPEWQIAVVYGPNVNPSSEANARLIAACAPTPSGALLDERDVLAAEVEAMRKDADRYRWLRRKVCIVGGKFHILNLDPRYIAPDAAVELDAAIDAELAKVGAA